MWQQQYLPVADSLGLSALVAALPILVLLMLIGVLRKPAWIAALSGLVVAAVIAVGVYGMPPRLAVGACVLADPVQRSAHRQVARGFERWEAG